MTGLPRRSREAAKAGLPRRSREAAKAGLPRRSREAAKAGLPRRSREAAKAGAAVCLALLCWGVAGALALDAGLQSPIPPDARFAGLQWTFARVRYQSWDVPASHGCDVGDQCWAVDYPAAEQNLSRRLKTVTAIQVNDPVVVTLDDPSLFLFPWIYIVEPGTMELRDSEVTNLREFLLRGGTVTFDDFHGPVEWAHFERQIKRVFPDRRIVELPRDHPIYNCFYEIDQYPQTPGLGSFLMGRTWEKGGFVARLRAVQDDSGRAMVLINWNTDMGDGWEWSNAADYPGYIRFTAQAYRMQINEIIYSLTH